MYPKSTSNFVSMAELSEQESRKLKGIYTSQRIQLLVIVPKIYAKLPGYVKKVQELLRYSKTFSKFKHVIQKFKRLKVRSLGINHIWSKDVAFMEKRANQNGGYPYLLIAVDVLSRFVRVQPIKSKSLRAVKEAFRKMLTKEPGKFPFKIWTDQGSEFRGDFEEFCNQNHIEIYHTFSDSRSSLAERCIRTLKTVLYKVFEENGSYKYISFIQKLVKLLNARKNRSIGMAPVRVRERDTKKLLQMLNAETVAPWRPSQKNQIEKSKKQKSLLVIVFEYQSSIPRSRRATNKNIATKFSKSPVCRDQKSTCPNPVSYRLQGHRSEKIQGRFYNQELEAFRYNISQHRPRHQTLY